MIRVPISWLEWLALHDLWKRPTFLSRYVADSPDDAELRSGVLLCEKRGGYQKWAHFRCPRCSEHIQISIANGPNSWRFKVDFLNRPTLAPSIWQTGSCGAHFFIRRGKLLWCAD